MRYTKEELEDKEKELLNNKKNGWIDLSDADKKKVFDFSEEYKDFLMKAKVEREAVKEIVLQLKENGFKDIDQLENLSPGDKVYYINNAKSIYAAKVGEEDIIMGTNILASHIDSPRLDLKPNPIVENDEIAYAKTHYYGGVKKYQWTAIPLALKGVITKYSGEIIDVNIGEKDEDPIFVITDLLPHLAREQMVKRANDFVPGEKLNVIIGSEPIGEISNAVKLNILDILKNMYGITEKELQSAELNFVPAFKPKDLGLDRSMIAAYGQDDKACTFGELKAFIDAESKKTTVALFADKEEVGSQGNTGLESRKLDMFMQDILDKLGKEGLNTLNKVYTNSNMLSTDVDGLYDPLYPEAHEKLNNSHISKGLVVVKYTGVGGKSGGSDANSEYMTKVLSIFEKNNVKYQVSELGKIDLGGGGTIAFILANKGVNVVDSGVGVLSMHSPYEVSSKFDMYEMYKGYSAFLRDA